jgi:hypothetical protein
MWSDICKQNGPNDSIVYVMQAVKGSKNYTYIGKTLNTMAKRYPAGPNHGLKLVWDLYAAGGDGMWVSLYNVSNPCLVEGWCYQVAVNNKLDLANAQDPS